MFKNKDIFRDTIFFALLLFLCKIAIERAPLGKKESPWTPFPVHKLDNDFLDTLSKTKKQINHALLLANNQGVDIDVKKLETLKHKIENIEEKYKKNSPATFLLGPIGTMSIVLKEQKIEQILLDIINQVGIMLNGISKDQADQYAMCASIEDGLKQNQKLLSTFS